MKSSLRQALPDASSTSLELLAGMLSGQMKTTGKPFQALLADGCSPIAMHALLLEHRDRQLAGKSDDSQFFDLRHYDRLQFLLLQAVSQRGEIRADELESRLLVADHELQLSMARNQWIRAGEVTLYNYFREVPITACVALHDAGVDGFWVERTPDLVHVVAAGQHGQFAHIRLPDLHSCLRLALESSAGKLVRFRFAGIFQTARERRKHIRVQCKETLRILLHDTSGRKFEVMVQDMS